MGRMPALAPGMRVLYSDGGDMRWGKVLHRGPKIGEKNTWWLKDEKRKKEPFVCVRMYPDKEVPSTFKSEPKLTRSLLVAQSRVGDERFPWLTNSVHGLVMLTKDAG